ncbi:glycerophosphodiester phosphodiesterase [Adhaeribacter pallidiroseus]|uniref:Glycerophosphodiester phosphodiesterase n=1 Tax=Adhaeribacter pallidiroseus TaxID=2072847 RepID=A0A369QJ07_9BACT|nr:glycerophosphodiester phosphodiesterase family protein [Adhaeribacter pallidiroseus]RDC64704.1 Glycerophosphodiester phosphodiesterase [Adhaeribacter pallidiroseus]
MVVLFFVYDAVRFSRKMHVLTSEQKNVQIIGHAGRAFFSPLNPFNPLPPNSRQSLLAALHEDGADGLEVDVHVSRDGIPILYHDETLNTMSEGKGRIEDLLADDVLRVAYTGGWFYDLFHDEKLISLEDLLREIPKQPEYPYLHLDLRSYNPSRNAFFAQSVMRLLRKYHYPLKKLSLVYYKPDLLQAFRDVEPQAKLYLDISGDFEKSLKTVLGNRLQGLVADGKHMDAAKMKLARYYNLKVILFGGKARNTIYKMILLQPDAIEVNNVKAMRAMVR